MVEKRDNLFNRINGNKLRAACPGVVGEDELLFPLEDAATARDDNDSDRGVHGL